VSGNSQAASSSTSMAHKVSVALPKPPSIYLSALPPLLSQQEIEAVDSMLTDYRFPDTEQIYDSFDTECEELVDDSDEGDEEFIQEVIDDFEDDDDDDDDDDATGDDDC
jgi:hypothetical protein